MKVNKCEPEIKEKDKKNNNLTLKYLNNKININRKNIYCENLEKNLVTSLTPRSNLLKSVKNFFEVRKYLNLNIAKVTYMILFLMKRFIMKTQLLLIEILEIFILNFDKFYFVNFYY